MLPKQKCLLFIAPYLSESEFRKDSFGNRQSNKSRSYLDMGVDLTAFSIHTPNFKYSEFLMLILLNLYDSIYILN